MVGYKQILCVLLFTISSAVMYAQNADYSQNNTNSPYTRYGYGQLADQTPLNSRAMGGIAYGLRDGIHVNALNPASYSAIDSLTFIFEGGYTLQNLNLSDGVVKKNAKNSSFDYVGMQFRLRKGLGISLGFLPYSYVGYHVSELTNNGVTDTRMSYYGDGGFQQVYLGLGGNILKNLAIGANVSYLWGNTTKTRAVSFASGSNINPFVEQTYLEISDFKFDFGAQYSYRFDRKNAMTVGVVFSPKMSVNNDLVIANTSSRKDSTATFEIPMKIGAGVTYKYDDRLLVGVDYTIQKWGDVTYMNKPNSFYDMTKIAVGVEYLPSFTGRNFFSHIKYRAGAYYSTPYYKIESNNTAYRATKEFGVTAGFAIPLPRRSIINISAQYSKVSGQRDNMLDENYLKLTIGLTFNERWFFKRKVD